MKLTPQTENPKQLRQTSTRTYRTVQNELCERLLGRLRVNKKDANVSSESDVFTRRPDNYSSTGLDGRTDVDLSKTAEADGRRIGKLS